MHLSSPACTAWVDRLCAIQALLSCSVWRAFIREGAEGKKGASPPGIPASVCRAKRLVIFAQTLSSSRSRCGSAGLGTMVGAQRAAWLPRFHRAGPSTSLDEQSHQYLYSISADTTTSGRQCQIACRDLGLWLIYCCHSTASLPRVQHPERSWQPGPRKRGRAPSPGLWFPTTSAFTCGA